MQSFYNMLLLQNRMSLVGGKDRQLLIKTCQIPGAIMLEVCPSSQLIVPLSKIP